MTHKRTTLDLAEARGFIFDMDGVLYRGNEVIPGAAEFLAALDAAGIPFRLLTNNASATQAQYAAKLAEMGIVARPEQVMTSSLATADYLAQNAPPGARVYAIGMEGVRQALQSRGFTLVDRRPADYVVVGIDWNVTYMQLREGALAIRAGAGFIGTNGDKTFPHPDGIVPGNGALLAFLEAGTGVKPTVIGKPNPAIFIQTQRDMGSPAEHTVMVGDRLDTDIEGAALAGLPSVMVLSGVHTQADVEQFPIKPNLVFEDIGVLYAAWRAARSE